jgi:acyl-CoA thioesterase FadM
MATLTNTSATTRSAVAKPPRMKALPAYAVHYTRQINYSDMNSVLHLDSAVLCRFVSDALMQFWMELFRMPSTPGIGVGEWLARISGYEARGIHNVVIAHTEQRIRYLGEGFCRETVHIELAISNITKTGCTVSQHFYIERPSAKDGSLKRYTIALAELSCTLLDPVAHCSLPITPELHAYLVQALPPASPTSTVHHAALLGQPRHNISSSTKRLNDVPPLQSHL